ncbi:MAG: hypothetical protein KAI66_24525 [Lentisphaeria bacterium]|nr:hypothetical protein [Lentisphaeria bacterium]
MNDQQTQADDMPVPPSSLAIAALVLGILALGGLGPLTGIPAVICGIMVIRRGRAVELHPKERTMATTAMGMGVVSCAVAAILLALVALGEELPGMGGRGDQYPVRTERYYQRMGGLKLGKHLAAHHAIARIVILTEPGTAASKRPNPTLDGFKEGLGKNTSIVATVKPVVPASAIKTSAVKTRGNAWSKRMLPPLEYWFTGKVLDEVLAPYKGKYDIVVTTIGLPQNGLKDSVIWKSGVKFAISNGSAYERYQSIVDGTIVAVVTYNPKATYRDLPPPADPDKAFDKRYLLLTPENVKQVKADHPGLFKK